MNNTPLKKLVFVVATKDRPDDLRQMLESLRAQTRRPDGVIVVDASLEPVERVAMAFPEVNPVYLRADRPSASGQRNTGVRAVPEDVDLIGFLDDDATLEPDAVENMMRFWADAPEDLGGAAFNYLNPPPTTANALKRSRVCRWLGLYSPEPGRVMPSGWQTLTGTVPETVFVDWLPSGASVWRREALAEHGFEEYFEGYSYLEDLDFSYSVRRNWRLAVMADAGFWHFPASGGRIVGYRFGHTEVRNRLFFVQKHGLSTARCCLAIAIRGAMTLAQGARGDLRAFQRAMGNVAGFFDALLARDFRAHVSRR